MLKAVQPSQTEEPCVGVWSGPAVHTFLTLTDATTSTSVHDVCKKAKRHTYAFEMSTHHAHNRVGWLR